MSRVLRNRIVTCANLCCEDTPDAVLGLHKTQFCHNGSVTMLSSNVTVGQFLAIFLLILSAADPVI